MQDQAPIDRAPAAARPATARIEAADPATGGAVTRPVDFPTVWRLLAPWLGYLLIGAAGVLGLFTASGAPDDATYDAGFVTFAIALCIIALRIKHQLDGRYDGLLLPLSVEGEDALLLYMAVVGALGVGGLVLAAMTQGIFSDAGLAFFCICALLVFYNLKRYFDLRDQDDRASR